MLELEYDTVSDVVESKVYFASKFQFHLPTPHTFLEYGKMVKSSEEDLH